jgi:hypothetical protein
MENIDSTGRDDDAVAGGFDQTNDLAGDQLGESDGTVDGAQFSAAERTDGDDSLLTGGDDDDSNGMRGDERSEGVRGDGDVFPGNPARGGSGGI